jgi:hypothetical protein
MGYPMPGFSLNTSSRNRFLIPNKLLEPATISLLLSTSNSTFPRNMQPMLDSLTHVHMRQFKITKHSSTSRVLLLATQYMNKLAAGRKLSSSSRGVGSWHLEGNTSHYCDNTWNFGLFR